MPVRASAEVRAKLVALKSEREASVIAGLRAVADMLPALWVGIAEDTLTKAELWAAYRQLYTAAGQVGHCAHTRGIRDGEPEL